MAIDESVQGIASGNIHNKVLEILQSRASSGRVLDVPSGQGVFARRLAAAGFEAIGVDVEPQEREPDFEFHQADLSDGLPLADGSVDYVMSIEGIEHLEKPFDFVRECHRVCAADGFLVMTTPNISAIRSRWRWFWTGYHNKCKYMLDENNPSPLHHINMFSFPKLRYLLHTCGFSIETVTTNRIKAVNWLYLPFIPLIYLASRIGIAKASRGSIVPELSLEVLGQMMSKAVLFGECTIVIARKVAEQ
jgi:2-polyprenyl-3-methyl-5-hydroxy-6-metoxy-1,4-benzoquinol methylase